MGYRYGRWIWAAVLAFAGCASEEEAGLDVQREFRLDAVTSALSSEDVETLMELARDDLGTWGGQCKRWVQNVFRDALGVAIPANGAALYEWQASDDVTALAAWRATYAAGRVERTPVAARGWIDRSIRVWNADPYLAVVYGPTSLRVDVIRTDGSRAISDLAAAPAGAVSSTFNGAGEYTVRVRNPSAALAYVTVAVISRSRFVSDWETARRGDVVQMRIDASGTGTGNTPHTALVQTDRQDIHDGPNWIHSNWCPTANEMVCERRIDVAEMIRRSNRLPEFGFTIYRAD